jgi:hypothetical protein
MVALSEKPRPRFASRSTLRTPLPGRRISRVSYSDPGPIQLQPDVRRMVREREATSSGMGRDVTRASVKPDRVMRPEDSGRLPAGVRWAAMCDLHVHTRCHAARACHSDHERSSLGRAASGQRVASLVGRPQSFVPPIRGRRIGAQHNPVDSRQ